PDEIGLDVDGTLCSATLAAAQTFAGVTLPAGSRVTFWSAEHPDEAVLVAPIELHGLFLEAGSKLCFREAGRLAGVYVATETFIDGGRIEAGDHLDYQIGGAWRESSMWPLWRPSLEPDTLDDPDVKGIDDLTRLYPLPEGFAYEVVNGRTLVRRRVD